jgi:hypothetical protein
MTVHPAAFYLAAALLVAAAVAAVVLPRLRHAGAAAAAMSLMVAVLFALSGAYAMAVAQLALTVILTGTFAAVLLRREPYCRIAPSVPPTAAAWWPPAAIAAGFGALLVIPFALTPDGWHVGSATARLVTLLHYRAPYVLVVAAVLALTAGAAAFLIGRTSADERELDRAVEAHRQREERMRRRREDRAAARRARPGSPAEAP